MIAVDIGLAIRSSGIEAAFRSGHRSDQCERPFEQRLIGCRRSFPGSSAPNTNRLLSNESGDRFRL